MENVLISSGVISSAGIYSLEGVKWCSIGQNMTKEEISRLCKAFVDPTKIYEEGIVLENKKYCCLSAQPHSIVGRSLDQTISIAKSKTSIVVGVHKPKVNSNTAHNLILRLANYLTEHKL